MNDALYEAAYELQNATINFIETLAKKTQETLPNLVNDLKEMLEEIEEVDEELKINHHTIYKSKIKNWMIIFDLLKIPIK